MCEDPEHFTAKCKLFILTWQRQYTQTLLPKPRGPEPEASKTENTFLQSEHISGESNFQEHKYPAFLCANVTFDATHFLLLRASQTLLRSGKSGFVIKDTTRHATQN